jgi:hypothetical protein
MVQDRDRHATLIARQSRLLLRNLVHGIWDFMLLLDLDEAEVDTVIGEMIEFVEYVKAEEEKENKKGSGSESVQEHFVPRRTLDRDTLWLKTRE